MIRITWAVGVGLGMRRGCKATTNYLVWFRFVRRVGRIAWISLDGNISVCVCVGRGAGTVVNTRYCLQEEKFDKVPMLCGLNIIRKW